MFSLSFHFAWPLWDREGKQEILLFLPLIWLSQPLKSHYRSSERRGISHNLNTQLSLQLLPREGFGSCFILMNVLDPKLFTIHQLLPTEGQRIKPLCS